MVGPYVDHMVVVSVAVCRGDRGHREGRGTLRARLAATERTGRSTQC